MGSSWNKKIWLLRGGHYGEAVIRRGSTRSIFQLFCSYLPEFKECFTLFDGDSDGMVTAKELALIMRSLGENITHVEIAEFMKKAGKCKFQQLRENGHSSLPCEVVVKIS